MVKSVLALILHTMWQMGNVSAPPVLSPSMTQLVFNVMFRDAWSVMSLGNAPHVLIHSPLILLQTNASALKLLTLLLMMSANAHRISQNSRTSALNVISTTAYNARLPINAQLAMKPSNFSAALQPVLALPIPPNSQEFAICVQEWTIVWPALLKTTVKLAKIHLLWFRANAPAKIMPLSSKENVFHAIYKTVHCANQTINVLHARTSIL